MKKFKSPFPKKIIKEALEEFKDNPPILTAIHRKDYINAFMANILLKKWWVSGGYKELLKSL